MIDGSENGPLGSAVKGYSIRNFPKNKRTELRYCCARIDGFLERYFERGNWFCIWDAGKFSKLTHQPREGYALKPRSEKHIQRVWSVFMKNSEVWAFEKIRLGRSFRWRVTRKFGARRSPGDYMTDGHIRGRLVGYIKASVERDSYLKTSNEWLTCFCDKAGVRLDRVKKILPRITDIEGLKVRSFTVGENFILKVSLPHSSHPVSSPSGRNKKIQTTCGPSPQAFPSKTSASLRAAISPSGAKPNGLRPWQPLRGCEMAVDGPWVSRARLLRLACWLARGPMHDAHFEGLLVSFVFVYARNFAFRALEDGHDLKAIVSAWNLGIRKSHADARDQNELSPRIPSAAVAYAWKVLQDGKTSEARWIEFFESDRSKITARCADSVPKSKRFSNKTFVQQVAVVKNLEISNLKPASEVGELRAEKLIAYLAKKGFSVSQLKGMNHVMREQIVRSAAADQGDRVAPETTPAAAPDLARGAGVSRPGDTVKIKSFKKSHI